MRYNYSRVLNSVLQQQSEFSAYDLNQKSKYKSKFLSLFWFLKIINRIKRYKASYVYTLTLKGTILKNIVNKGLGDLELIHFFVGTKITDLLTSLQTSSLTKKQMKSILPSNILDFLIALLKKHKIILIGEKRLFKLSEIGRIVLNSLKIWDSIIRTDKKIHSVSELTNRFELMESQVITSLFHILGFFRVKPQIIMFHKQIYVLGLNLIHKSNSQFQYIDELGSLSFDTSQFYEYLSKNLNLNHEYIKNKIIELKRENPNAIFFEADKKTRRSMAFIVINPPNIKSIEMEGFYEPFC